MKRFSIIATRKLFSILSTAKRVTMLVAARTIINGLIVAIIRAITPHKDRTIILNLHMFFHQKTITNKSLKGFVIDSKSVKEF